MPLRLRKTLAGALSLVYFLTQCALAHAPEAGFWAERRRVATRERPPLQVARAAPSAFLQPPSVLPLETPGLDLPRSETITLPQGADRLATLPAAYGTLQKILLPTSRGKDAPVVIHIQDVHMNAEAQSNIGHALRHLTAADGDGRGAVGLVALEGAFGNMDFERFQRFPRRDVIQTVADYFLKAHKISGPVHAALTGPVDAPPYVGIDDPARYEANVEAYRRSAPRLREKKTRLAVLVENLAAEKERVFNPALRAFDARVQDYEAGRMPLGDHVKTLLNAGGPETPTLAVFGRALGMEAALDFAQVENERGVLLRSLADKLDADETARLLQHTLAFRAGRERHADFYRFLRDLCRANGLSLDRFPAMDAYLNYVLLADGIDAHALFEEMTAREDAAYRALAATPAEAALVAASKKLRLTGKLIAFSLNAQEWDAYRRLPGDAALPGLDSFEDFYREARARDDSMAANLLNNMRARSVRTAVLVTGGFHANGLDEKLRKQGVAVLTVVPKISKVESADGASYLSVFTQEKSPLEKIFQGERLFLPAPPFPRPLQKAGAALHAVGVAALLKTDMPSQDVFDRLATVPGHVRSVDADGAAAVVHAQVMDGPPLDLFLQARPADGGIVLDNAREALSRVDVWEQITEWGASLVHTAMDNPWVFTAALAAVALGLIFVLHRRAPRSTAHGRVNGRALLSVPLAVIILAIATMPLLLPFVSAPRAADKPEDKSLGVERSQSASTLLPVPTGVVTPTRAASELKNPRPGRPAEAALRAARGRARAARPTRRSRRDATPPPPPAPEPRQVDLGPRASRPAVPHEATVEEGRRGRTFVSVLPGIKWLENASYDDYGTLLMRPKNQPKAGPLYLVVFNKGRPSRPLYWLELPPGTRGVEVASMSTNHRVFKTDNGLRTLWEDDGTWYSGWKMGAWYITHMTVGDPRVVFARAMAVGAEYPIPLQPGETITRVTHDTIETDSRRIRVKFVTLSGGRGKAIAGHEYSAGGPDAEPGNAGLRTPSTHAFFRRHLPSKNDRLNEALTYPGAGVFEVFSTFGLGETVGEFFDRHRPFASDRAPGVLAPLWDRIPPRVQGGVALFMVLFPFILPLPYIYFFGYESFFAWFIPVAVAGVLLKAWQTIFKRNKPPSLRAQLRLALGLVWLGAGLAFFVGLPRGPIVLFLIALLGAVLAFLLPSPSAKARWTRALAVYLIFLLVAVGIIGFEATGAALIRAVAANIFVHGVMFNVALRGWLGWASLTTGSPSADDGSMEKSYSEMMAAAREALEKGDWREALLIMEGARRYLARLPSEERRDAFLSRVMDRMRILFPEIDRLVAIPYDTPEEFMESAEFIRANPSTSIMEDLFREAVVETPESAAVPETLTDRERARLKDAMNARDALDALDSLSNVETLGGADAALMLDSLPRITVPVHHYLVGLLSKDPDRFLRFKENVDKLRGGVDGMDTARTNRLAALRRVIAAVDLEITRAEEAAVEERNRQGLRDQGYPRPDSRPDDILGFGENRQGWTRYLAFLFVAFIERFIFFGWTLREDRWTALAAFDPGAIGLLILINFVAFRAAHTAVRWARAKAAAAGEEPTLRGLARWLIVWARATPAEGWSGWSAELQRDFKSLDALFTAVFYNAVPFAFFSPTTAFWAAVALHFANDAVFAARRPGNIPAHWQLWRFMSAAVFSLFALFLFPSHSLAFARFIEDPIVWILFWGVVGSGVALALTARGAGRGDRRARRTRRGHALLRRQFLVQSAGWVPGLAAFGVLAAKSILGTVRWTNKAQEETVTQTIPFLHELARELQTEGNPHAAAVTRLLVQFERNVRAKPQEFLLPANSVNRGGTDVIRTSKGVAPRFVLNPAFIAMYRQRMEAARTREVYRALLKSFLIQEAVSAADVEENPERHNDSLRLEGLLEPLYPRYNAFDADDPDYYKLARRVAARHIHWQYKGAAAALNYLKGRVTVDQMAAVVIAEGLRTSQSLPYRHLSVAYQFWRAAVADDNSAFDERLIKLQLYERHLDSTQRPGEPGFVIKAAAVVSAYKEYLEGRGRDTGHAASTAPLAGHRNSGQEYPHATYARFLSRPAFYDFYRERDPAFAPAYVAPQALPPFPTGPWFSPDNGTLNVVALNGGGSTPPSWMLRDGEGRLIRQEYFGRRLAPSVQFTPDGQYIIVILEDRTNDLGAGRRPAQLTVYDRQGNMIGEPNGMMLARHGTFLFTVENLSVTPTQVSATLRPVLGNDDGVEEGGESMAWTLPIGYRWSDSFNGVYVYDIETETPDIRALSVRDRQGRETGRIPYDSLRYSAQRVTFSLDGRFLDATFLDWDFQPLPQIPSHYYAIYDRTGKLLFSLDEELAMTAPPGNPASTPYFVLGDGAAWIADLALVNYIPFKQDAPGLWVMDQPDTAVFALPRPPSLPDAPRARADGLSAENVLATGWTAVGLTTLLYQARRAFFGMPMPNEQTILWTSATRTAGWVEMGVPLLLLAAAHVGLYPSDLLTRFFVIALAVIFSTALAHPKGVYIATPKEAIVSLPWTDMTWRDKMEIFGEVLLRFGKYQFPFFAVYLLSNGAFMQPSVLYILWALSLFMAFVFLSARLSPNDAFIGAAALLVISYFSSDIWTNPVGLFLASLAALSLGANKHTLDNVDILMTGGLLAMGGAPSEKIVDGPWLWVPVKDSPAYLEGDRFPDEAGLRLMAEQRWRESGWGIVLVDRKEPGRSLFSIDVPADIRIRGVEASPGRRVIDTDWGIFILWKAPDGTWRQAWKQQDHFIAVFPAAGGDRRIVLSPTLGSEEGFEIPVPATFEITAVEDKTIHSGNSDITVIYQDGRPVGFQRFIPTTAYAGRNAAGDAHLLKRLREGRLGDVSTAVDVGIGLQLRDARPHSHTFFELAEKLAAARGPGLRVIGVDLQPDVLTYNRLHLSLHAGALEDTVSLRQGDFSAPLLIARETGRPIDLVVARNVLVHHLSADRARDRALVLEALREGGHFVEGIGTAFVVYRKTNGRLVPVEFNFINKSFEPGRDMPNFVPFAAPLQRLDAAFARVWPRREGPGGPEPEREPSTGQIQRALTRTGYRHETATYLREGRWAGVPHDLVTVDLTDEEGSSAAPAESASAVETQPLATGWAAVWLTRLRYPMMEEQKLLETAAKSRAGWVELAFPIVLVALGATGLYTPDWPTRLFLGVASFVFSVLFFHHRGVYWVDKEKNGEIVFRTWEELGQEGLVSDVYIGLFKKFLKYQFLFIGVYTMNPFFNGLTPGVMGVALLFIGVTVFARARLKGPLPIYVIIGATILIFQLAPALLRADVLLLLANIFPLFFGATVHNQDNAKTLVDGGPLAMSGRRKPPYHPRRNGANRPNVSYDLYKAAALIKQGDVDGAIALLNQFLALSPTHSGALTLLAQALLQRRDYASAHALTSRFIVSHPQERYAVFMHVQALMGLARPEDALKAMDNFFAQNPRQPPWTELLTARAQALMAVDRYEEAEAEAREALILNRANVAAWVVRMRALLALKREEEVVALTPSVLAVENGASDAAAFHIALAHHRLGRLPEAMELIRKKLGLPENHRALISLAWRAQQTIMDPAPAVAARENVEEGTAPPAGGGLIPEVTRAHMSRAVRRLAPLIGVRRAMAAYKKVVGPLIEENAQWHGGTFPPLLGHMLLTYGGFDILSAALVTGTLFLATRTVFTARHRLEERGDAGLINKTAVVAAMLILLATSFSLAGALAAAAAVNIVHIAVNAKKAAVTRNEELAYTLAHLAHLVENGRGKKLSSDATARLVERSLRGSTLGLDLRHFGSVGAARNLVTEAAGLEEDREFVQELSGVMKNYFGRKLNFGEALDILNNAVHDARKPVPVGKALPADAKGRPLTLAALHRAPDRPLRDEDVAALAHSIHRRHADPDGDFHGIAVVLTDRKDVEKNPAWKRLGIRVIHAPDAFIPEDGAVTVSFAQALPELRDEDFVGAYSSPLVLRSQGLHIRPDFAESFFRDAVVMNLDEALRFITSAMPMGLLRDIDTVARMIAQSA